jgi:hypothetical protein
MVFPVKYIFLIAISYYSTIRTGNIRLNQQQTKNTNTNGITIATRFSPPNGFIRTEVPENTFQHYLRNLPLKPVGSRILLFNGREKSDQSVGVAVIDLETGNRDLQQCADAVIRLRAEYLYSSQQLDSIHFNLTNGFRVDFSEWVKGKRVKVDGNRTWWVQSARPSNSYGVYRSYLDFIFTYAGTLSLSKELKKVSIDSMQIGDVFIQGGSPGHAVIVVDMAVNPSTGERVFMLAQSYMPAQDIHILANPSDSDMNPWYSVSFGRILVTPEWTFNANDMKRF